MGCVGTCILLTVREVLYRLICSVGCCNLLFCYLRGLRAKIYDCGTFIYEVVLVTVTRIFGLRRCVHLNFSPKHRVLLALYYGYTYIVLVGRWLWIVIGV